MMSHARRTEDALILCSGILALALGWPTTMPGQLRRVWVDLEWNSTPVQCSMQSKVTSRPCASTSCGAHRPRDRGPLRLRVSDEASAAIPFDEGNGDTPLIRAARFGQLAHVLYLLKDDAAAAQVADKLRQNEEDVEEEEKEVVAEKTSPPVDQRALMLTQQQRPAADIEARNKRGETALLAAASSQNMQVVQCLTEHGADVHATDMYGNQCLHCSAGVPPVVITRHLLEANADVNASNGGGLTPLHLALQSFMLGVPDDSNRIAMTQLLLSAGAKVDVRDKDGLTPAELGAAANATEETLALLEDHPKAPGP